MKSILKQVVGIDVGSQELVLALGSLFSSLHTEIKAAKAFRNSEKGFNELLEWVEKLKDQEAPLWFVMEATGVYHEKLAYFLNSKGYKLSIVLPNKISNYMRTLETRTITDKTCAEAITRFGLERAVREWQKPNPTFKKIRQLTREREQIIAERTIVKNQKHAEEAEAHPSQSSIKRMEARIRLLVNQEKEIKREISKLIAKDEATSRIVKLLCSIPGIAELTAATIVGETNGFELIQSRRQLAGYVGLDVREKQSGISVKGKACISKKGNKYLRKAMYLPALCAIRFDTNFKNHFARLVSRHGIKMKAVVAVERKLLELAYTLYKNNKRYQPNYSSNAEAA